MNKSNAKLLIFMGLLLLMALNISQAEESKTGLNGLVCQKFKSTNKDKVANCLACCGQNGFNRFDGETFYKNGECKCYKYEPELGKTII